MSDHEQRVAAGLELLDVGTPALPDDLAGFVRLVLDLDVERAAPPVFYWPGTGEEPWRRYGLDSPGRPPESVVREPSSELMRAAPVNFLRLTLYGAEASEGEAEATGPRLDVRDGVLPL
jgi:hypothetical protein